MHSRPTVHEEESEQHYNSDQNQGNALNRPGASAGRNVRTLIPIGLRLIAGRCIPRKKRPAVIAEWRLIIVFLPAYRTKLQFNPSR
jgi:hypothetical protein